jgi:hypothetical protein
VIFIAAFYPSPAERVERDKKNITRQTCFRSRRTAGRQAARADDAAVGGFEHDRNILSLRKALVEPDRRARPLTDRAE